MFDRPYSQVESSELPGVLVPDLGAGWREEICCYCGQEARELGRMNEQIY